MTQAARGVEADARLRRVSVAFPLPAEGGVRLGVVADTHSRPHRAGLRALAAQDPDLILHAGDIGDLEVLTELRKIAPVHAVRGNIDPRAPHLPDVLELALTRGETSAGEPVVVFKIVVVHIGLNGTRIRADAARAAQQNQAQLLVCGHSHVPFMGRDRGLAVFNPGSMGPRRFLLPIVFGMAELTEAGWQLWHVDCETGKRWAPS